MTEKDLHGYQRTAVDLILENTHCGLFLDMGLGKTVSTLTAVKRLLYEELAISNVLVIAPKRVASGVWSAELSKWGHLEGLRISKVIGTEKQRLAALAEKAEVYTIGRDNVAWLCGQYGGTSLPFDMLVIDESSSFKSPKSIRFKSLRKVQPSFDRVVLLTGTPAPNGLMDLWAQLYLLDRGERLGKTLTSYRDKYFKPGRRNGAIVYNYRPLEDSEKEIHKKIGDICMSMKAEDYLDLPARVDNFVEVELGAEVMAKYAEFEEDLVIELFSGGQEITAVNGAVLSNKLLQFANGTIYDDEKNAHDVHPYKLEALDEIVENAQGRPVLVAYTYKHDKDRIMAKLKKYRPRLLKDDKDVDDWNAGRIQVLVMHPASGGHGLNLQDGGDLIVWYGQTWSLELYMQFNARLYRQGQTRPVVVNHLIAQGTLDQDVMAALGGKARKQESLMQAVKARINKYIER